MVKKREIRLLLAVILILVCFISALPSSFSGDTNSYQYSHHNIMSVPPSPIRQVAEFEPMQASLIRYNANSNSFGIPYQAIKEMAEDVTVITIVANVNQQNTVLTNFQNQGVNIDNCEFLIAPSNTHWTRDYGPWFVFTDDDELAVIDFTYSRDYPNRYHDDNINSVFSADQDLPLYFMPLFHEGGNYMTDGQGIAISTDLVWDVNPGLSPSEIDDIVFDYLNVSSYHVVPDINGEYIRHVDCWGKYLAPDVIMIREVPSSHSQYTLIEEAVDYFESQINCYGTPYTVVRVYTPNNEPYTNSLILNNKVLVPLTGASYWDNLAIQSYQQAMPGYEILGFYGSWHSTDALHCRVMGIPDRYMLYLEHTPLSGYQSSDNGYEIQIKIQPYSGTNLIMPETGVYWRSDNFDWNFIPLSSVGCNFYRAVIPPQENGTTISYYIQARDASGRMENHPYIGEPGAHMFTAYGELNHPPEIPQRPWGPATGEAGSTYRYSTSTIDIEDDLVFYLWEWGDGTFSEWIGPYSSGETASTTHTWTEKGTFSIRVKACDIHGEESDWSEPFVVSMPKNQMPFLWRFEGLHRLISRVLLAIEALLSI
ncbi:MAG: agmatine deiminase family protein [Thermoplasmatota archaeon]